MAVNPAHNRGQNRDESTAGFFERSVKAFQENVIRSAPLATASYTLIGAIILFGGIGFWLDRRFGTGPWFLLGGLLLGLVVGFYQLAKVVWHR